jgi:hypothetical protein
MKRFPSLLGSSTKPQDDLWPLRTTTFVDGTPKKKTVRRLRCRRWFRTRNQTNNVKKEAFDKKLLLQPWSLCSDGDDEKLDNIHDDTLDNHHEIGNQKRGRSVSFAVSDSHHESDLIQKRGRSVPFLPAAVVDKHHELDWNKKGEHHEITLNQTQGSSVSFVAAVVPDVDEYETSSIDSPPPALVRSSSGMDLLHDNDSMDDDILHETITYLVYLDSNSDNIYNNHELGSLSDTSCSKGMDDDDYDSDDDSLSLISYWQDDGSRASSPVRSVIYQWRVANALVEASGLQFDTTVDDDECDMANGVDDASHSAVDGSICELWAV